MTDGQEQDRRCRSLAAYGWDLVSSHRALVLSLYGNTVHSIASDEEVKLVKRVDNANSISF